jgi:alpha-tubulin suppressor-like RCC1 family protein
VVTSGRGTCAIDRSGALYCWGDNASGQVGDGTKVGRYRPVRIGADRTWIDVSRGHRTCAVATDGGLCCWGGWSDDGPSSEPIMAPLRIGERVDWARVASGSDFVCALDRAGQLACWGGDNVRQLGAFATTPFGQFRFDPSQITRTSQTLHYKATSHDEHKPNTEIVFRWLLAPPCPFDQALSEYLEQRMLRSP